MPRPSSVDAFDADAVKAGKFELGELTLEIAPAQDRERLRVSQGRSEIRPAEHGHAVDRYPAEPRFEVVYHLHSIERNERLRLKCRVRGDDPGDRFGHRRLARGQLVRARSFRPVRHPLPQSSRSAPHPDAGRLGRLSAAQGLSGHGDEGLAMSESGEFQEASVAIRPAEEPAEAGRPAPHDPQHGAAAPVDARRAAPPARTRRRDHRQAASPTSAFCTPASKRNSKRRPISRRVTLTDRVDYLAQLSNNLVLLPGGREAAADWRFRRRRSGCA